MNPIIALFIGLVLGTTAGLLMQRSQVRKIATLEIVQGSLREKIAQLEKILHSQRRKLSQLEQSQGSLEEKIEILNLRINEPPETAEEQTEPDNLGEPDDSVNDNNPSFEDEAPPPDEPVKTENTEIIVFLKKQGIEIKNIPVEQSDEVLGQIAMFMGNRYSSIDKFYRKIKSHINYGTSFRMSLKNESQEKIASITHLATKLHKIAFLEAYQYQKAPKFLLYAMPNKIPPAINFLNGQWLERFIKDKIIQLIHKLGLQISYSYLINPQIILPNGDDFELDVLVQIGSDIFWFEAKTGDYQRHINKYSKISSILGLDRQHSYMILTDIEATSADALSSVFSMTVVNVEKFADHFEGVLSNLSSNIS